MSFASDIQLNSDSFPLQQPSPTPDRQVLALQLFLDNPAITPAEWMQRTGLRERSFYEYKRQAFPPTSTEEVRAANTPHASRRKIEVQREHPDTDTRGTALVQGARLRKRILYTLFFAATVASAENMFYTISQFAADTFSAVALTVVFALTAIGFTAAGMQRRSTLLLIGALVAFEAFCNCTNIYGGLYDFRTDIGNTFLMRVQSILWLLSAKHCATIISFFAAGCIAAVQYTAIREIHQPPRKIAVRAATKNEHIN